MAQKMIDQLSWY